MARDTLFTIKSKTAAGYDAQVLQQEQRRLMRKPATQVWKNEENSPLTPILQENPSFTVLIVDDNRPIRHLVRSILLAFGVQNIEEADDGVDAIKHLHNSTPDLVITDLEMAPMNGLEFTRQVRRNPRSPNPNLPIVVMTSYTEKDRILEIRKAGLTEVMAKPVTPKLLARNILTAIENYERKLREGSAKSTDNPDTRKPEESAPKDEDSDQFLI